MGVVSGVVREWWAYSRPFSETVSNFPTKWENSRPFPVRHLLVGKFETVLGNGLESAHFEAVFLVSLEYAHLMDIFETVS